MLAIRIFDRPFQAGLLDHIFWKPTEQQQTNTGGREFTPRPAQKALQNEPPIEFRGSPRVRQSLPSFDTDPAPHPTSRPASLPPVHPRASRVLVVVWFASPPRPV